MTRDKDQRENNPTVKAMSFLPQNDFSKYMQNMQAP